MEKAPQGSIFSTTRWMSLWDKPIKILGCYRGDELVGGIIGRGEDGFKSGFELTQFQGILALDREREVAEAVIDYLSEQDIKGDIANSYNFTDMRPFIWNSWKVGIRYTYIVDSSSRPNKDTRYQIRAESLTHLVQKNANPEEFAVLYQQTFERKRIQPPGDTQFILNLIDKIKGTVYLVTNKGRATAGVVVMGDSKMDYYILGASDGTAGSSLCLWTAIQDHPVIDLCGCNNEKISLFKSGFGGRLTPYYVAGNL